ncbi:MAG: tRNA (guanosine(46)-N7)-methyltransferase TrmB, partial [Pseudomonadota bacterium]
MKNESIRPLRTIRSFVIREGRFTDAQKNAVAKLWPNLGIEIESAYPLNLNDYFLTLQPLVFDIGFGNGESLISIAQQRSDLNFVGIEVYRPGIGMVLRKIEELDLNNIRIINADVMNVLSKINDDSLLGVLIWFPDPWPKKRHQKRRLIQKEFLLEIIRVLQSR